MAPTLLEDDSTNITVEKNKNILKVWMGHYIYLVPLPYFTHIIFN